MNERGQYNWQGSLLPLAQGLLTPEKKTAPIHLPPDRANSHTEAPAGGVEGSQSQRGNAGLSAGLVHREHFWGAMDLHDTHSTGKSRLILQSVTFGSPKMLP